MNPTAQLARPLEVLIVEDNPGDVRLATEALKEFGVANNSTVVGDGAEALAYLRRAGNYPRSVRPDIVFLDLNLPKLSGLELLDIVKSDDQLKEIPIIVLTSSQAERDVNDSYDRHANCFITKPNNLEEYAQALKSIECFWFHLVTLPSGQNPPDRAA